jgi:hypothetical protein
MDEQKTVKNQIERYNELVCTKENVSSLIEETLLSNINDFYEKYLSDLENNDKSPAQQKRVRMILIAIAKLNEARDEAMLKSQIEFDEQAVDWYAFCLGDLMVKLKMMEIHSET